MSAPVTISLLPVPLALVHIPRSRLHTLSHPILRHILNPSPVFFNITANQIELSLFVNHSHVHDFQSIANDDRRSIRNDPVEISQEPWSVLQIDSHTDQLDNAGARVHELSAPLAAAGISILYQSSYMSDFIFAKQSRLHEALSLFEKAGFGLYTSNTLTISSLSSPSAAGFGSNPSSPTVLTRARSSTAPATPSSSPSLDKKRERTKSHSPTSGEVRILQPDLACVGLSDELGVDHWGLKIVKLVAFPELVPSTQHTIARRQEGNSPPDEYSSSQDNAGSISGQRETKTDTGEDESDDDGYFSHSPHSKTTAGSSTTPPLSVSPPKILTAVKDDSGPTPPHPLPIDTSNLPVDNSPTAESLASPPLKIPFFSFTRTQEGSSLTADVNTLAALFPPEERHLLVYCGDLGLDSTLDEGCEPGSEGEGDARRVDEEEDLDQRDGINIEVLKCLQIDLRRFGLDKHGLVNKFSKVLEENGINHMYSSTFKTANLLVDKTHAVRAQALLRGC